MSTTAASYRDWRLMTSGPIDRSKRIAPGAEVDPKHIMISKFRPRKEINYKLLAHGKSLEGEKENVRKNIPKVSPSTEAPSIKQRSPLSDVPSPMESHKNEQSVKNQSIVVAPQVSISKHPFTDAIIAEIVRLGGELPQQLKTRRYNSQIMPLNWALWGRIKFPQNKSLFNETLQAEFTPMEILFEPQDVLSIPFLKDHPDFYILGEGPIILVSKLSDTSADPNVWIADDSNNEVDGPFTLSSFLKGCTLIDKIDE